MGVPPPTGIPPQLMGEYYRLAALWCSTIENSPQIAQQALRDIYQLSVQNQAQVRTLAQSLAPYMSAALSAAGYAYTSIGVIMAEVAGFISGAIAAAAPVLMFILALCLLAFLYWFLDNWWYQNVTVPREMQRRNAVGVLANPKNIYSPLYSVSTRHLPPGMVVSGLS